ncbi:MAG: type II toxin-antitoxin system RelB/DinJ family antitoxin [Enterococcus sp.]|nr:type II toxin-antitoxin system RelB/DinJ family antitoxin [Enterococcus sp.]
MGKTASLYIRIEPEVKEQAESILSSLGITASNAINMFYNQIILQRGLPLELKVPAEKPLDISTLSKEEFDQEIDKGLLNFEQGDVRHASDVFDAIHKDYQI